jgi:hypothetical protein
MKDFLFVFRNDYKSVPKRSPEEMEGIMKQWMDWMGSIAAQGKLSDKGNRLGSEGRVVGKGGLVTDGPYTEIKELIGGYIAVKAATFEEASEIAKGCPILREGGNVEVRDIVPM